MLAPYIEVTNKADLAFLECLTCLPTHLKVTVDSVLLSTSQENKVRFGEIRIHAQERGPGISCGGFIIVQCPLDRLPQHSYYSRSAYNICSIFCICKHDYWLSRGGRYSKVLSKGYILGFWNLRSSEEYHFIRKNKRGKNPYSIFRYDSLHVPEIRQNCFDCPCPRNQSTSEGGRLMYD